MIKNISLNVFQVFLTVAETGSMTQAAKIHNMTQSGVSRMMDNIEKSLGTELFDRGTLPLKLTSVGRFLRSRCMTLIEDAAFLEGDITSFMRNQQLDLRIGTSTSVTRVFSPLILSALMDRVNSLNATTGSTPLISRQLLNDEIDIAICSHALESTEFICSIPLYTEDYLVVLPKQLDRTVNSKADLMLLSERLPCVHFGRQTSDGIHTSRLTRLWGATRRSIHVDVIDSVLELVSRGQGWAIMPTLNILPAAQYFDRVTFRHITPQQGSRTIFLLYKNQAYASLANEIRALIEKFWFEDIAPRFEKSHPIFFDSVNFIAH